MNTHFLLVNFYIRLLIKYLYPPKCVNKKRKNQNNKLSEFDNLKRIVRHFRFWIGLEKFSSYLKFKRKSELLKF